jgi:hypothetical protein
MSEAQSLRAIDRVDRPAAPVDPEPLLGEWRNTNPDSRGIVAVSLRREGDRVLVRAAGAAPGDGPPAGRRPLDWGEAAAGAVCAAGPGGGGAAGFTVRFDHGFGHSVIQAHLAQGRLSVAVFNRVADASGRSDYLAREFYSRPRRGEGR